MLSDTEDLDVEEIKKQYDSIKWNARVFYLCPSQCMIPMTRRRGFVGAFTIPRLAKKLQISNEAAWKESDLILTNMQKTVTDICGGLASLGTIPLHAFLFEPDAPNVKEDELSRLEKKVFKQQKPEQKWKTDHKEFYAKHKIPFDFLERTPLRLLQTTCSPAYSLLTAREISVMNAVHYLNDDADEKCADPYSWVVCGTDNQNRTNIRSDRGPTCVCVRMCVCVSVCVCVCQHRAGTPCVTWVYRHPRITPMCQHMVTLGSTFYLSGQWLRT